MIRISAFIPPAATFTRPTVPQVYAGGKIHQASLRHVPKRMQSPLCPFGSSLATSRPTMMQLLPLLFTVMLTQTVMDVVRESHTEERLLREADLVVEAIPVWVTTESFVQEVLDNAYPHEAAARYKESKEQGFRIVQIVIPDPLRFYGCQTATTFRVLKVVKGSYDLEKLVLHHFQGPFGWAGFRSPINFRNPVGVTFDPATGKRFRLYLNARPYGAYRAASGDFEPSPSFHEMD